MGLIFFYFITIKKIQFVIVEPFVVFDIFNFKVSQLIYFRSYLRVMLACEHMPKIESRIWTRLMNLLCFRKGKVVPDETGCYMFVDDDVTSIESTSQTAMAEYFDDGHTEVTVNYNIVLNKLVCF